MLKDNLFDISNKTALVTGAGRGIGYAIANGFSNLGCSVGGFDKDFLNPMDENISSFRVDLKDNDDIQNGFESFTNQFKRIDILVNCAGITIPNSSEDYETEDWLDTMNINLNSVFSLCKLVGNQMISQGSGGSIINLTSIGAEQGFPNNPAYCSSKGGLKQLTKALAFDWGKYKIRVNNLVPGYTNTPMNKKSWNDKDLNSARAKSTFLDRWAEPEEMVGPAIFLASDASSYVTGSDLVVDGGWTAKGL